MRIREEQDQVFGFGRAVGGCPPKNTLEMIQLIRRNLARKGLEYQWHRLTRTGGPNQQFKSRPISPGPALPENTLKARSNEYCPRPLLRQQLTYFRALYAGCRSGPEDSANNGIRRLEATFDYGNQLGRCRSGG